MIIDNVFSCLISRRYFDSTYNTYIPTLRIWYCVYLANSKSKDKLDAGC